MTERESGATPAPGAVLDVDGTPRLAPELEGRVRQLVARFGRGGHAIMPALRLLRQELGALDDEVLRGAAPLLEVRAADLKMLVASSGAFGMADGAHEIVVCVHRHCRARGALRLLQVVEEETGAPVGGERNGIRLDTALCLGACTIGPNVEVDGACWHAMTEAGLRRIARALAGGRRPAGATS